MSPPKREVVMKTKRRGAIRRVARGESGMSGSKSGRALSDVVLDDRPDKILFLQEQVDALRRQLDTRGVGMRDLDRHPVAYIEVRASGLIAHANAATLALFGRDRQDVFGLPLHQFVAAADRGTLVRYLRQCALGVATNGHIETELNIRGRNNWVPARLISHGIDGSDNHANRIFPVAIVDLTESRVFQQWLSLEDKSFQRLLESIDGVVWEAEYPLKILYVSGQVERVLGYPPERWLREPRFWEDHIHVDDRERFVRERETAFRIGGHYVLEYRFHSARNGVVWLRDSMLITRTAQGHTRIQGLAINITPLKNAEIELRRANRELASQAEEHRRHLEHTVQSMETFCYGIAHELRAPVRAMRGFADVTLEELGVAATPEAAHHLQRIAAAATYMDKLIDDLLAYGRLHHTDLLLLPVRINNTIGRVLHALGDQIEKANAIVHVQPTPERVHAHPMLLAQALENLLNNALKFVPPGKTPEVEIDVTRVEGERVRISVRDNGVGIDPAYQHKIFGVFQRAHSSDEFPGTGIGLAMVKRIVDLLDGEVGVVSAPGEGSTFWIDLPAARVESLSG